MEASKQHLRRCNSRAPHATIEAIQAGYTAEEFTEIIPELQQLVDDKKSGKIAPTYNPMTREEGLGTFAMANVPIISSNQHGGDMTRLFDEATFRSANAVLHKYAVDNKNTLVDRAPRKGSQVLALPSDSQQRRASSDKGEEAGALMKVSNSKLT